MHPAPLAVHAGRHAGPDECPSEQDVERQDPAQGGERRGEPHQVQEGADGDVGREGGGREELADVREAQGDEGGRQRRGVQGQREEGLQRGEDSHRQDRIAIGRGLASVASRGRWRALRRRPGSPRAGGHLPRRVAVPEEIPDLHRPSRGLEALRQARDGDRVSASPGESVVRSQRIRKDRPADRERFLAREGPIGIGVRWPATPVLRVRRSGQGFRAGAGGFRSRLARGSREPREAPAVDLSRDRLQDEPVDEEDPGRDRRPGKLAGERRRHLGRPGGGGGSDRRSSSLSNRRRDDEGDECIVLGVDDGGLDLGELRLEEVLDRLGLDAVATHLELRVDPAEEVHTLHPDVDPATIAGPVEAAESGVGDELLGGQLREVAVPARDLHTADAELPHLPVGQRAKAAHLEHDVGDAGKRGADGDGLSRTQALTARVGARLGGTVGVDDLPPSPRPRFDQRAGECLAGWHDVTAQRIGQVHLGGLCEGGEEDRRAEEHRDLGLAEDGDEVRAGPDLLLGEQDHGAARHPGAVHLGDAAVVPEGRGERARVEAGEQIEVVRVAEGQVHVARVCALHALGHPGGPARVEDRREALRGVVQPGRRFPTARRLRELEDVERRQAAEAVLAPCEDDHRPRVVDHVADQRLRQGRVEEHHGAAGLEDAEVRGHDLPVVLRHRDGHDLVRAREVGSDRPGDRLRARVEFGEGEGLPGERDLQGREIREALGGAAEDLREPPGPGLVRRVHEVAIAEDLGQAVRAGVLRPARCPGRPEVLPPRDEGQSEEDREDGCRDDGQHALSPAAELARSFPSSRSTARASRPGGRRG